MITTDEQAQLERIADQEADFYAQVLYLTLQRLQPGCAAELIADTVVGTFKDLNERVIDA